MSRLLLFVVCTAAANAAAALTFTTHFPAVGPPRPEALLVSPADPNIVYEIAHDTLFRSSDGGATFTARSNVSMAAVDRFDPNLLYEANGPRRSEDGGLTWKAARDGMPNLSPTPRMIVVTSRGTVFISSTCYRGHIGGGVFSSHDRATSWSGNLVEEGKCVGYFSVDPISESVYPSYEYETNVFPTPVGIYPSVQIVASPRNPDVRYAIGYIVRGSNDSELAVLATSDGAKSWQPLTVDGSPRLLGLDEGSGRVFLETSNGLFFSDDRGVSWPRVPGAPAGVNSIIIAGSVLYAGTPAANYRAPLATLGPFTPLGPLPDDLADVNGFAIDPSRRILYAVGAGAWRSRDSGQHWEEVDGGDTTSRVQPTVDAIGDLYALSHVAGQPVTLTHYAAARGVWDALPTPFPNFDFTRLVSSPVLHGLLYAAGRDGLFVSNDGGHAWRLVSDVGSASDVTVDPSQPDVIYVAGTKGLFLSADGGTFWRRLDATPTSVIAVAPSRPATLYRICSDSFYGHDLQRSDDGGTSWRRLRNADTLSLLVDPLNADSVWLGALEHSIDGGTTWTKELGGLSEDSIGGYVIDRDGTHFHVYLNSTRLSGEFDAVLRIERRRPAMH